MSALALDAERPSVVSAMDPLAIMTSLLEQLRDVVTLLPPHVYTARPAERVSGSTGAHVRHALDHVAALVAAIAGEPLQYDHRLRGTTLETEPATAVHEIDRLLYQLDRLPRGAFDRAVTFSAVLHPQQDGVLLHSTLARELAFVLQHTIHHCALIAVLLEWQGWPVPRGFGLAPSTARAQAIAQ